MTPEERQGLRERHSNEDGYCNVCRSHYKEMRIPYPCDVIKALDWADEVLEELKGLTAHFEGIWY